MGCSKRIARFGITFEKPFRLREFSFDALVFPACSSCNTRFGLLEEQIKPLFPKLLAYEPISQNELITLLDWLDKIRVGLWLGYLYLDKNPFGINPNFHIESRLGRSDRMLSALKADHQGKCRDRYCSIPCSEEMRRVGQRTWAKDRRAKGSTTQNARKKRR